MKNAESKTQCCGCGACASICPERCITMQPDAEGFLYPSQNKSKCIACGQCERVCPLKRPLEKRSWRKCMAIQCRDAARRAQSTAGGAFVPIAAEILARDGTVYGAAFDEKFAVRHIGISEETDLWRLQGSKYVQSETGACFSQIRADLQMHKWVLFSGTPCQTAGLIRFLEIAGVQQERLLTVSVACRAVPSPLAFSKYVEMQQERLGGNIRDIRCRDKHYGYAYSTMSLYGAQSGKARDYHCGIESDEWLRCYFSGICDRPSCAQCRYKEPVGDFHNGDYFRVGEYAPELDDDRGTSRMVITSQKGLCFFETIQQQYRCRELTEAQLRSTTKNALTAFGTDREKRAAFFADAQILPGKALFQKYYPRTRKVYAMQYGRQLAYRLGVYKPIKKLLMAAKCRK